jgi:hypothetical protein
VGQLAGAQKDETNNNRGKRGGSTACPRTCED